MSSSFLWLSQAYPLPPCQRRTPKCSEKARILVFNHKGVRIVKPFTEVDLLPHQFRMETKLRSPQKLCGEFLWKRIPQWQLDQDTNVFKFSVEDPETGNIHTHCYAVED